MGIKDRNIDPDDYAPVDSFVSAGGDPDDESPDREGLVIGVGLDDPAGAPEALDTGTSVDIETHALTNWIDSELPVDVCSYGHCNRLLVFGIDSGACRAELLDLVRASDGRDKVVLSGWLVYCEELASLSSWLAALLRAGATVTAVGSGVTLNPDGIEGSATELLGELSAAALDPREHLGDDIEVLRHDWSGRCPVGTEVSKGALVPSQDYDRVRAHLLDVVEGGESRRQAAKRIGCSPRTVSRILDDSAKRELYRLPASGE